MASILRWAFPEKKSNRGGSGYEIPRNFEEIASGISRGYLKADGISRGD